MQQASTSKTSRGEFAWRLDADTGSIPAARHAFEAWLRANGASDDEVHDMAVVLSELASNAVVGSAAGTSALVHAAVSGGELHLDVSNQVDAPQADILRWDLDDPLRGGGRGLLIVRAYTDRMDVESTGGTVTVRCARRLEASS